MEPTELDQAFKIYMVRHALLPSLERLLQIAWSRDTCNLGDRERWTAEQPAIGQCAVTALLLQDLFEGDILRREVIGGGSHYSNRVEMPPDDHHEEIDFTIRQFPKGTKFGLAKGVVRSEMLLSPRGIEAKTLIRYELLKRRMLLLMRVQASRRSTT